MTNQTTPNDLSVLYTDHGSVRILPMDEKHLLGLSIEAVRSTELASWALVHRGEIEAALKQRGALLFRGFTVRSVAEFEQFVASSSDRWAQYREASTPRLAVSENVSTSTEYPARERIFLHNENSHCTSWPKKIYFWCEHMADSGGETPIADCRKIYNRIDEGIRIKFIQNRILYIRNFTLGLGISWQNAFNCRSKVELESYAHEQHMAAEWINNDHLKIQYVRPAVICHPNTKELVWFNHGTFFNFWALKPSLRNMLLEANLRDQVPYDTAFGSGEPISEDMVRHLMACYESETLIWKWQQGDVLLLDNMLMAHGRMPFTGKRRVLTGMADPVEYTDPALAISV